MTLSTTASKANSDAGTDDPAQSILTDLAGLVDKYNTTLTHLLLSPIIANPLQVGDGLEIAGGSTALQIKLPAGSGLQVGSSGLSVTAAAATRWQESNVITKSANFTVTSTDSGNLFVLNSSASRTATLPALAVGTQDQTYHFYNVGVGSLVIDGNGTDTVDGALNITLPTFAFTSVVSDNANSNNHTTSGGQLRTGKHTAVIRASALYAHPSGTGAQLTVVDPGALTTKPALQGAAYDDAVQNQMCFGLTMPKSWDEGTVDCYVNWTVDGTATGGVRWQMSAAAVSNDDTWNVSLGSQVEVTDTRLAQYDRHRSPVMTITPSGTIADNDEVIFMLTRDVADAADTMSTTAIVTSVEVLFTTNAGNDA